MPNLRISPSYPRSRFPESLVSDGPAAAGVMRWVIRDVGTIYRRFGDRSGLALAVLEDREAQLQHAVIRGPAPLGPDASPRTRLRAFLAAIVDLLETHTDLLVASEAGDDARFSTGLYTFYRLHTTLLLRRHLIDRGVASGQTRDAVDVDYLADALLAPLDAELYRHQRAIGMTSERIKAGLHTLVDSVLDCASPRIRADDRRADAAQPRSSGAVSRNPARSS